ncbi:calcium-binding and coiled-coil domain-containing protein 2 [Acanthopagrus latus]|uniref:calcium-binding and coiled-coil domain-containing protein 2 n=1 Tax=Acanthopagrus latus TaxID=8177 RepID=UPI00187C3194|nr:calcium-binding and coiled-coil domain-containing protein 2 [Acanthopagrus latus]XP_036936846.1 calcium-binding and coiled-coil domain-containing protein 2 [Acanthopagrus latus]
MEDPTQAAAAAAESPTSTFSQVVFVDIPHSYPPSTNITCCYTLNAAFQPSPRDWVGIFKVGWSTTKDYHTFVWVEPCLDVVGQQTKSRQAVFRDYYLPKDEIEFYQFCYVDGTGQVRGASTPFCFRNPAERSMESSQDDELLVITTQEQLEQSGRMKAELQRELAQKMDENETLKRALEKEQQDAASLRGQIEDSEKEKSELGKELDHIKGENQDLRGNLQQQLKETDQFKELLAQMTKQMEERNAAEQRSASFSLDGASRQNEAQAKEKYDRAVVKINQLKEERGELRRKVDAQDDEIARLNSKIREDERELFKLNDSVQLLQVDVKSSEKEKERLLTDLQRLQGLVHDMDNMKRENLDLSRRLSQHEVVQTCQDDDLKGRCQALARQLQETQEKLAAEKEESRNIRSRGDFLERELHDIREQLEKQVSAHEEAQRMKTKFELMLREAHEAIADKDSLIEDNERMTKFLKEEKDEYARENQNLQNDIEELRRAYTELHAASPADTTYPHAQPGNNSPAGNTSFTSEQMETAGQAGDNLYENIEGVEEPEVEALVCRHCQESFPLITRQELEQHEQSHRICPFCTMICDNMEQSVFEDHVYGHEL